MMKTLTPIFIGLLLVEMVTAQGDKPPAHEFSGYITVEKKYLVLPVRNGAVKRNVEIWVDGVKRRFFDIELAEDRPDWNAYLEIDQWKGRSIELRVDKITDHSSVFKPIVQSDVDSNSGSFSERLRPQFHFSPLRGWTNDPNGMVYYNGEYHLFYQHNPYGRGWGNMTWGHAVTKDLVHWRHLDEAIHPDQGGLIFSGGAVVDVNNTSGLGKPGSPASQGSPGSPASPATPASPAMVVFHTGATGWGQYMSWSTDGRTFQTLDHAVVPRINKDNRDPKVIWYAPTKKWVMVMWVERGDNVQHSMQFLTSPDLKSWTKTSVVMGGVNKDRYLFECPEFYELPVDGLPGVKKWVLTGANTEYAIGSFDGTTFTPEEQRLQEQHGRDFYAPQTFSDEPNGRRIEIGWWRTRTDSPGMTFNQSMSIPLEHRLVKTPEGIRLTRMPVKELEALRAKTWRIGKISLKDGGTNSLKDNANPLKDISLELAELRFSVTPGKAKEVVLDVRGVPVVYDVARQKLTVDGVTASAPLVGGKLSFIVYADRTGLEIFVNEGLLFMPININLSDTNRTLSLSAKGGTAKIDDLVVYELKSIWE